MSYSIGITTFSKRYDLIVKLIGQIRSFTNRKIILTINGEKGAEFDNDYRQKMLELCAIHDEVYPIFFLETRGLSKMWNTILLTSHDENVLMLNDDIEVTGDQVFKIVEDHIKSTGFSGLTKINGSFSHFIVNVKLMERIGFFDERLLGFGEEDGDITYRLLRMGVGINNIGSPNLLNIVSDIRHDHVNAGIGKYSKFNRDFIYNEKYEPTPNGAYQGMFDTPMSLKIPDLNLYPGEKYFQVNKDKL